MEGVMFSVAIICLVYLGIPHANSWSCVADINTVYRDMSCPAHEDRAEQGLHWLAEVNGSPETIATCDATSTCTSRYPEFFEVTVQNGSSRLIVKNASRTVPFDMETKWTCNYVKDNYNFSVCTPLTVIERPLSPVCEPHTLDNKTFEISVTCHIARAYPRPVCQMMLSKENGTADLRGAGGTTTEKDYVLVNATPEYYRHNCTITVSMFSLGLDGFYYRIRIYPLVDGVAILESAVYTDLKLIRIGLIEDDEPVKSPPFIDGEDNSTDRDTLLWLVIGLAVALTLVIVIAFMLALLACRTRQKKHHNMNIPPGYDNMEEPANSICHSYRASDV